MISQCLSVIQQELEALRIAPEEFFDSADMMKSGMVTPEDILTAGA